MNRPALAFFAILSAGCSAILPSTHKGASLLLKPSVTKGYLTQATVSVYDQDAINHLTVCLFQGGLELASKSLSNAQLDNPIVFSNLRANTTYQIAGYAYASSDNTLKISDDASSSLKVQVKSEERPTIGTLPVALIDKNFAAQASSSLAISPGNYLPTAPETMQFSSRVVSTLAGTVGGVGAANGSADVATFREPLGIKVDGVGNLYIADYGNHLIRKIDAQTHSVSTLAGSAGIPGTSNGTGSLAQFKSPWDVTVDGSGNLYVADRANQLIREVF